jgi:hypothetical protein
MHGCGNVGEKKKERKTERKREKKGEKDICKVPQLSMECTAI